MKSAWTNVGLTVAGLNAVAIAGAPQYTITDLTEVAAKVGVVQSEARAINEAGQIVGFEVAGLAIERAILWDTDGSVTLLPELAGDNSTIAVNIAEDGVVLGRSALITIEMIHDLIIIHEEPKATLWQDGVPLNLDAQVTGGDDFIDLHQAWDMNPAGQIVGFAGLPEGVPFFSNGFLFEDGIVTDLGELQRPFDINNHNQIAGYQSFGQSKAYLWDDGRLINLHNHPSIGGVTSRAYGINDAGIIIGKAQFEISDPEEATAWIDLVPTKLIPEFVRPQGQAWGINEQTQIVGFFIDLDDLSSQWTGFLWEDGAWVDLLSLLVENDGWEILYAFDINDRGQIVGGGLRNGTLGHAFVVTTPILDGDLDGDGDVDFADLLTLLAAWGDCPRGETCPADLDASGDVGFGDLLILLAAWSG